MDTEIDASAPTDRHEAALACVRAGIEAAHPERILESSVELLGDDGDDGDDESGEGEDGNEDGRERLRVDEAVYDLREFDRVVVVGGGKAAAGVAEALERVLGDRIDAGAVVTYDPGEGDRIEHLPGDHPVPSERGVESTRRLVSLLDDADERTLVLAVVTGGASALLPAPADGVSLSDLQATTERLLDSGADIGEINAVRKHLSKLKGGGLARAAAPATVVSLVFSDVVGNDLGVIASGPTVPDETTYDDALAVCDRYDLALPDAVRGRLERGVAGDLPETPNPSDPIFDRVDNHVLADGFTALDAARSEAGSRGYDACLLSSRVRGEAREAAKSHVAVGEEALATGNPVDPPAVVLSGGETTVTVHGDGVGGPNLEYALSAALELAGGDARGVLASVDTDGKDGGTDVAGALVDGGTLDGRDDRAAARDALARNDALPCLDDRDCLIRTGPTGTNVNDLRVLLVERD
jgi:hydroxypyruvate reductase